MIGLILVIDQGTTPTLGIIFGRDTAPVAAAQQELRQVFPQPGWVGQDPESSLENDARDSTESGGRGRFGHSSRWRHDASDWTMQFLSSMLDAPVDRPRILETMAFLAGAQAGVFLSLEDFCRTWRLERVFRPLMDPAERDACCRGWRDAVARTSRLEAHAYRLSL
jgi:glycerol kinase